MLNGTDYNIVSPDNEFEDFRAFFDEEELACFQKYGFALEDCLFFFFASGKYLWIFPFG